MTDPVIVVDYDSNWPMQFEFQRERAARALLEFGPRIEHVGSTAVPGLAAKPIIDLIVQIDDAAQLATVIQRLRHGDINMRAIWVFQVGTPSPHPLVKRATIFICAFRGCSQLSNQLAFRDYLRAHEGARAEYAAMKLRLAEEHRDDRATYTKGKDDFLASVLARLSTGTSGS